MIAEPGPADKLRVNESKGILPTKKKKPSRFQPERLFEIHDCATRYCFGVAGAAGFGAGLAGAVVAALTG
jgi:hypothetical protein